ncbi:MAG: xanthine dehydrogenase family protein molybdopterin-binding subunit [Chloroflexi bacterium]|nr:xanthine dehydrogenase family protein molybdopterin-binding subunit [Chloroflexota bacterium]
MAKVVKTRIEMEGETVERSVVVEGEAPPPWTEDTVLSLIGGARPRVDGPARVSGRAVYTADVRLPGMLYAKILRCPHAHARLRRIDVAPAMALRGVRAVLSHRTAPPIQWQNGVLLFDETLRFAGDEVAAVAADDEDIAQDALELIEVDYEVLPFVVDPEAALRPDAPRIHPRGNRSSPPRVYQRGDVARGFADADIVVETVVRTPTALHNCMEPHGSVAWRDGDTLVIWDSTQHVHGVREQVAETLGLPLSRVRVISEYIGGGFGSKQGVGKYTIIAALLARLTSRPVQLMLDRREENLATGNRHETIQRLRIGARRDGSLTAIDLRAIAAIGAYGGQPMAIAGPVQEFYRCPNVLTEEVGAFTNTGPTCAFRAPGYTEGAYGLETALDELAARLEIDPLELRLRNYADVNPVSGRPFSSKPLRELYRLGAEQIGWHDKRRPECGPTGARRRGVGMATATWGGGGGPPAHALVRINSDATVDVLVGTQDIGTGTKTVLATIAAEELGLSIQAVRVALGDTLAGPYCPVSAGSMTVASVGPAVRQAAREARQALRDVAATFLEVPASQLDIQDGEIVATMSPDRRMTIEDLAGRLNRFQIIGKGSRGANPNDVDIRTFGAQFAEVQVDTETGQVEVCRLVAVHECGRVINPLTTSSQVEGGVVQGIGYALMEERIVDPRTGKVLNPNLDDYKLPTVQDAPVVEVTMDDHVDERANVLGAKGLGEPPIIPTAPAIANAVAHALGRPLVEFPLTRARLLQALQEGQVGNGSSHPRPLSPRERGRGHRR